VVSGWDVLTAQQATRETADGKDRHVKLLSFEQAIVADRIIVMRPKCLHTVPNVAVSHVSLART
jgi:hypothetical protein